MNYYSDEHVVIRSMVKEDVQRFYDAFSLQGYHKPTEIFEHYLLQQRKQQCLVFVAEVDRQLAGYVTLWPKAKQGPFASLQLPVVVDLNVLEKFRKQGIGQKLMDEVEKQAKRFSSTITLGVVYIWDMVMRKRCIYNGDISLMEPVFGIRESNWNPMKSVEMMMICFSI